MFKRMVAIFFLVLAGISIVCVSCAEQITPFSVSGCRISAAISIANGNVQATCSASKIPDGYTSTITVVLQKKSGNSWTFVSSGSGIRSASASAAAVKGTTYRAYATCKLYDSTDAYADTISATSIPKTY